MSNTASAIDPRCFVCKVEPDCNPRAAGCAIRVENLAKHHASPSREQKRLYNTAYKRNQRASSKEAAK